MSNQPLIKTKPEQPVIPKSIKSLIASDYFKTQVALCLPKHLTPDRFMRVALTAVTMVPKLAQCTPESVIKCMMACSELGIEPDGRRAHLIPFWNAAKKAFECQLIIDYKGLVELAKRSGDVSNIHAQIVRENDSFEYDTGQVTHKIDFRRERGTIYAVYAVIKFKDGGTHTEIMTKQDVDRIRARSKAKDNGPWVTDYEEMAKKTVFRRASKWIVLSPEIQDALDKEDDRILPSNALVAEIPFEVLPDAEPPESEPASIETETKTEPVTEREPEDDNKHTSREQTPQEMLGELLAREGITFNDFIEWAEGTGNIPDARSLPDVNSVTDKVAKRLLLARVGLIKGIKAAKGTK